MRVMSLAVSRTCSHRAIAGNGTYTYYVRKHNGLIIFDSVTNVTDRALRVRNCE